MTTGSPIQDGARPLSQLVAANIRAGVARRGWKQKDLAKALGITPTAVSRKWLGHRAWHLDELDAVAKALGVPVQDLFHPHLTSN